MSTKKIIIIISIGVVLLFSGITVIMGIGYSNQEKTLRVDIQAKEDACKSDFDAMWKVISQQAQIAEDYKESFKEIYPKLIEGRYDNEGSGGTFMKWIQESNPDFNISLYEELMRTIRSMRQDFSTRQKELIAMTAEHTKLLRTFPSSIFVGGRKEIHPTIITSSKTKETYQTGEDNDVDLFKK